VIGLSLAALFIALNGFLVAAEFALVKLRATQGPTPARTKVKGRDARIADAIARIDRYLSVTQLGITLCSLGLGWIGEPALAKLGTELTVAATGRELGTTGQGVVFALAFTMLTMAHVLFGELVPKLIAIQKSREAAVFSIPLLSIIRTLLYPLLVVLEVASRAVLRIIGLPFDAYGEAALSEEEILGILAANVARSPRGEAKHELLRRVMRFSERTAKTAMVPRVDVAALPIDTPGEKALEYVRQQQYSRVLLLNGTSLDQVAGYLYAKDLLFDPQAIALPGLAPIRRDLRFVPESQGLVDVLRDMQRAQTPIAVVVDEYGGTSGIITMEDLLEEIVGEIRDELDHEAARIEKKGDGWEMDAGVTLDELRAVGIEAEANGEGQSESVGAVVLARLKRLPRVGDRVDLGGATAEVLSISRRRVTRLRVRAPAP
jgi:CBS domain containing-hemolysin-like protein